MLNVTISVGSTYYLLWAGRIYNCGNQYSTLHWSVEDKNICSLAYIFCYHCIGLQYKTSRTRTFTQRELLTILQRTVGIIVSWNLLWISKFHRNPLNIAITTSYENSDEGLYSMEANCFDIKLQLASIEESVFHLHSLCPSTWHIQ